MRTFIFLSLLTVGSGLGLVRSAIAADPAQVGEWAEVQILPWRPVHSILLPTTGKVMMYSHDDPRIWDPAGYVRWALVSEPSDSG